MSVFVLPILACLIASPTECELVEIRVPECNALGLAQAAAWAGEHPDWRITKWWPCAAGDPA